MRNVVDRGCPYDVKIIGHSAVGLNIGNLPLYPNNVYQQPAHKNLTLFSITEFDKHMQPNLISNVFHIRTMNLS